MSRNNKHDGLRVKPVRRYPRPEYPSHIDPDPTQHPYAVPYPISRDVASTLLDSNYRTLVEGLVYSPAAIMIVAFTRRA